MNKGRRYDEPKLNLKKVFAVIILFIVIIMFIIMLMGILDGDETEENITSMDYFAAYQNNKWGVIDSNGNIVIDPSYAEMIIVPNSKKDVFLCTFDVNYDDAWYAVCFSVDELEDEELRVVDFGLIDISSSDGDLAVFADSDALYPDYLTEYYDGVKMLESVRILDSATFWNELFPPLSDAEIIEDFSQGA